MCGLQLLHNTRQKKQPKFRNITLGAENWRIYQPPNPTHTLTHMLRHTNTELIVVAVKLSHMDGEWEEKEVILPAAAAESWDEPLICDDDGISVEISGSWLHNSRRTRACLASQIKPPLLLTCNIGPYE